MTILVANADSTGLTVVTPNVNEAAVLTALGYTPADVAGDTFTGPVVLAANAAPADGTLSAGQAALWFDKTDGSAKVSVKAKQANGTVKTGSFNVQT